MSSSLAITYSGDPLSLRVKTAQDFDFELKFESNLFKQLLIQTQNTTPIPFAMQSGVRAVVYQNNDVVTLNIVRNKFTPEIMSFQVVNLSDIELHNWGFTGRIGQNIVRVRLSGATLSPRSVESNIVLVLRDADVNLLIDANSQQEFLTRPLQFSMLSQPVPTSYAVPAGMRTPEFSLGIFDDSAFKNPRPIRLGVPVISTVPVEPPSGAGMLSGNDLILYTNGQGSPSRAMYFRAICNQILPLLNVQLMIYLPSGIDTFAPPIYIPLASADGGQTFTGSYVFHAEDTVNWIDGLCLFNVFVPMHIQTGLPMRLIITPGLSSSSS